MKHKVSRQKHSYLITVVSSFILLVLAVVCFRYFYSGAFFSQDYVLVNNIEKLKKIFDRIDQEAGILSFRYDKNYIDFLNVEKFSGSEIGSINLRHPDKWKGPYLKDVLTYKGEPFMVARTATGYYIVPGENVKLGNGKIIGKDIVISSKTDMEKLMRDPKGLMYKNQPLAAKITIQNPAEEIAAAFEDVGGDD